MQALPIYVLYPPPARCVFLWSSSVLHQLLHQLLPLLLPLLLLLLLTPRHQQEHPRPKRGLL